MLTRLQEKLRDTKYDCLDAEGYININDYNVQYFMSSHQTVVDTTSHVFDLA